MEPSPTTRRAPKLRLAALVGLSLLALVAVLAETADWDFGGYLNSSLSTRWLEQWDPTEQPLSTSERAHRHHWEMRPLPGDPDLKAYYRETRDDPWLRLLPCCKSGTTTFRREFFIVRDNVRVAAGEMIWKVEQLVLGIASPTRYEVLATPKLDQELMQELQAKLAKSPD